MYINFWYPVCTTEELAEDTPVRAEILGLRFVAFRDAGGQARVLSDTCVHRGGSLSRGMATEGRVACPYHGWQFDGSGRCVHIPVLEDKQKIPARAKVDSYPTEERYGIVFAFLGDLPEAERPPFCEIKEWGREGWRANRLVTFEIDAYFERSIENGIDPVHNEFVHVMQGNIRYLPEYASVESDEWGSSVTVRMEPPKPGTVKFEQLRDDPDTSNFGATTGHVGPNSLITRINLSASNSFVQYFYEQPISADRTRIFFVNMRNCMLDDASDQRIEDVNKGIAAEDIRIVEALYPKRTPEVSTKEVLIIGDECIGTYRKHLKGWEQRGWRIDVARMTAGIGDIAYAIPCPGRRTEKNWVLDPVPLIGRESQAV